MNSDVAPGLFHGMFGEVCGVRTKNARERESHKDSTSEKDRRKYIKDTKLEFFHCLITEAAI